MKKIIFISIFLIVIIISGLILAFNNEISDIGEINFENTEKIEEIHVAFVGDQGGSKFVNDDLKVLELLKEEGVELVIHQGDLGFEPANPTEWDNRISKIFGESFPYVVSLGHHDQDAWKQYQVKLSERIERNPELICHGELGVKSNCTYKDLSFVLIAPGEYTSDDDYDEYVKNQLTENNSFWKICSMHNELTAMEYEKKIGKTGMEVFEACREAGAVIASGHLHLYARSGNLIKFVDSTNQIIDSEWTNSNKLRLTNDSTFIFVSGLGGSPIFSQIYNEWPVNYTETQNALHGALFCKFNAGGQENKAYCYFKNIEGKIIDEFTITSFLKPFSNNLDFIDGDYSNADFTNQDLSNKVMIDSNFENAKFTNAKLSNSVFIGSILTGADLTNTNLSGVSLSSTELTGVKLTGADLTDANLSGKDLSGIDLSNTKLTGADLTNTNLTGNDLSGLDLSNTNLSEMDLSGMDLNKTILTGADLSGTNLSGINLATADLTGVKLRESDLSGMNLNKTILTGADLTNTNLSGVSLSSTELTGVKLTGADLSDTNLSGIDLTNVNFDRTDLSGKNLSHSKFDFVSLKDTKMANVDLSFADMREVDFTKIKNKDLSNSDLSRTSITYSNLKDIDISNTKINDSNLNNSDLSKIDFTKIQSKVIQRVNFLNSNLEGANFSGMKFIDKNNEGLIKVHMSSSSEELIFEKIEKLGIEKNLDLNNYTNTELTQILWDGNYYGVLVTDKKFIDNVLKIFYIKIVQFQNADLRNADFSGADLTFSFFQNANLSGANLSGADLTQANLSGANLSGANLSGANLNKTLLQGTNLKCFNHEICE